MQGAERNNGGYDDSADRSRYTPAATNASLYTCRRPRHFAERAIDRCKQVGAVAFFRHTIGRGIRYNCIFLSIIDFQTEHASPYVLHIGRI